jgi:hypothetical protein
MLRDIAKPVIDILQRSGSCKKRELAGWFSGPTGPLALFFGRVLAFDSAAAMVWARLMVEGSAKGEPRSALGLVGPALSLAGRAHRRRCCKCEKELGHPAHRSLPEFSLLL